MATTDNSDQISKREATYRQKRPKFPVRMYWTREGSDEVPAINIKNPDEDVGAQPIYETFDVETFDELAEEVFGTTDQMPFGENDLQIGVLVGLSGDAAFFTDRELLGFVEGVSDDGADVLLEWYDDLPSLCEEIRRGQWFDIVHDVGVDDPEVADELREIDNMEQAMKDAKVWQEPDHVTADDW